MSSKVVLAASVLLVVGGGLYALARMRAGQERTGSAAKSDGSGAAASMRLRALAGSPTEFGITPVEGVWGVLMEMGFPEGWATLVALSDGNASLYLSSGGGVIGGGYHEKVKRAASSLCGLAEKLGRVGPVVTAFPTPGPGRIRFYVLTTEGVQTVEESEDELGAGAHRLSPLFMAGHEVITELRQVTEGRGGG